MVNAAPLGRPIANAIWLANSFKLASVVGIVAVAMLAAAKEANAQQPAKPAPGAAPLGSIPLVENKQLLTRDGVPVHVSYFPSSAGKEAACMILLHGKKGSRIDWHKTLVPALQQADIAVVTVDLRGHGETPLSAEAASKNGGKKVDTVPSKARDYEAMVTEDLEAVKRLLYEEHQAGKLNMRKLAIGAAEQSAAVAFAYFKYDWDKVPFDDAPTPAGRTPKGQDVQALVLLSPETSAPGLATQPCINLARTSARPVLVVYGSKDTLDKGASKKLFEQLTPRKEIIDAYVYSRPLELSFRGTELLGKKTKIEEAIVGFVDKHVKKAPIEWRDRRSQLER